MPNYSAQATRVAAQIAKFGAPAVLERALVGEYDPNFAEPDDDGTQVYNTVAVRASYRASEIDGTRIQVGDARLLIAGTLATEPKPGDVIRFDGAEYLVVSSSPVKPATVVVAHDVQVRNA
jgi:hypothetical protein